RDLDRRLAEEQSVVADVGLHRDVASLARPGDPPRLVAVLARIGHRKAGAGGDDLTALDLLVVDRRGRQVQPDVGPLLTLGQTDQNAAANHDQALVVAAHGRRYEMDGKGG